MGKFYLSKLKTKEELKRIIAERWNYELLPQLPFAIDFKEETDRKIIESAVVAEHARFRMGFFRLNEDVKSRFQTIGQFLRSTEREIIAQIPVDQRQTKLFVFSSKEGEWWHFVHVQQLGSRFKLKRFVIEPDNRDKLRTACERLDKIKIDPATDTTLQKVKTKHKEAFSIEAITNKFFKEYIELFNNIKQHLYSQKKNIDDALGTAHHYTHQLLNRIMFLYFVQKRDCFGGNKNFFRTFWNAYRDNFEDKNEFFQLWLKVLFFEALNHKFFPREYFKLPKPYPDFNEILQFAPFLNGGLFKSNELDQVDYQVEDKYFVDIFDFFENYNFTVQENTPLDQDLSIDPEMLGNIYEMLVNVSETEDERHKTGIFYTSKTEIELMVRRTLVEFLSRKTEVEKKKLYQFIFHEENGQKLPDFSKQERDILLKELDEIKIVDPACGSGHYLVVATQILYQLKKTLYQQRGITPDKFKLKKEIIENSIFGVDVKEWATDVAKLRLWLDLFVDAKEGQFKRPEPLLPSLSFKIRVGDSLLQEIGGVYFSPSAIHGLPSSLKGLLVQLKNLKKRFYYNDQFVSENQIKGQELGFYRAILEEKIKENQARINKLKSPLIQAFQQKLVKVANGKGDFEQIKLPLKNQKEIEKLEEENRLLREQEAKLSLKSKFAFWPIEFAEVFVEKGGFDIVIANPPYVRQEIINDPTGRIANKQEYKEKLGKQIEEDWNDPNGDLVNIPKRSDLYVYFYLKGLKLLNLNGILCYISSNSWLDVGYGAKLQEILLRRTPTIAIYDNQVKRSFKHADINTVIVILGTPKEKDWQDRLKENIVRFVMFKKPFEEIISPDIFLKVEKVEKREENELFKVFPVKQIDLWKNGAELPKDQIELRPEHYQYQGDKWGGKYLRAPEIYWKILERGKNKLVRLGDIAEVRFGIKTGANKFFYLEDVTDLLEE